MASSKGTRGVRPSSWYAGIPGTGAWPMVSILCACRMLTVRRGRSRSELLRGHNLMALDDIPPRELPDPVADETRRIRRLRVIVDLTASILRQQVSLTEEDARRLIAGARASVLDLFPEKGSTFDLVLAPRFERILHERGLARPPDVRDGRSRS